MPDPDFDFDPGPDFDPDFDLDYHNNKVSQSVPHLHVHIVPRRRKDGLKGFFWPRHKYGDGEMVEVRYRLRSVIEAIRRVR